MRMLKMALPIALLLTALLLLASGTASAQTARPTGATQGSVTGSTYSWPQAGISFTLPQSWRDYGYRWYERWGPDAAAFEPGTAYVVEWTFTPKVLRSGETALFNILVYPRAEWDKVLAQPGTKPVVWGEGNGYVYAAMPPQNIPYDPNSPDGQSYGILVRDLALMRSSFRVSGGATTAAPAAPAPSTADGGTMHPSARCRGGTGSEPGRHRSHRRRLALDRPDDR
jgi:hypothetical protein